ncbi:MAG: molecular chaperone HtpG [Sandaracinus sp.]
MTEPQTVADSSPSPSTHAFEAEVEAVLRLVVHSLYSHPEVFLRELISNASDALDKRRFRAIAEPDLLPEGATLRIRLEPDENAGTLTIADDGVGMTKEELGKNLGTIAKSGTRELAEKLKAAQEAKGDLSLIGQFGVGFYSAFLVADRVDVISRAAGARDAWKWSSDGQRSFTLEPAARVEVGTDVVLHLKEDQRAMLTTWRLEELVRKYSDYVHFPIELKQAHEKEDTPPSYKKVNQGAPLWQRPASEVTEEQYEELYRHLSHDFEKPLAHDHFKVEGTQEFRGVLYVPRVPPFDLFHPDTKGGLRLYVKHVFVLEEAEELLPRWLRFVRGVVDSEDLPLNVSREVLQDSRVTKTIKKQVQKRALDLLGKLATEKPEEYATFWRSFGAVLKEGLHFEPELAPKIGKLLRFETTNDEAALSSLDDVKSRMKEGQSAIYYLTGESKKSLLGSPHLEALKKRGYEVLLLADPVDPFAMEGLREWEGTKLVSAAAADLDLGAASEEEKASQKDAEDRTKNLRDRMRIRLQEHVKEVRVSSRLVGSAAALVVPEGDLPAHVRRLLARAQQPMPEDKRILEINPDHPTIRALAALVDEKPVHPDIDRYVDDLYVQAQIAEGTPIEDPGTFARRYADLLTLSIEAARAPKS